MDDSQQGQGHGAMKTVEAKVVGQRKPAISGWQVPLPALPVGDRADTGGYPRLRDLLAGIVRQEALAFRQRQEERRLVRVLSSPAIIQQAAATGKIDMGGSRELQAQSEVDDDAAVAAALQAFEDGLYFVFLDGQQQEDLDAVGAATGNSARGAGRRSTPPRNMPRAGPATRGRACAPTPWPAS